MHNSLSTLVFLIFGDKYENSLEFDQHVMNFFKSVSARSRMFRIVYIHGSLYDSYWRTSPIQLIKNILPQYQFKMLDFSFVGLNFYSRHLEGWRRCFLCGGQSLTNVFYFNDIIEFFETLNDRLAIDKIMDSLTPHEKVKFKLLSK